MIFEDKLAPPSVQAERERSGAAWAVVKLVEMRRRQQFDAEELPQTPR